MDSNSPSININPGDEQIKMTSITELQSIGIYAPTFKLTFYDRMLEIGLGLNQQKGKFDKLVSPDPDDPTKQGDTVVSYDPPLEQTISDKIEFSVRLDYTDDYKDPRKGIRNIFYYDIQNSSKDSDPSFDVLTNDLQIYVPVLEKSTIVFDLQMSDAIVKKKVKPIWKFLRLKMDSITVE